MKALRSLLSVGFLVLAASIGTGMANGQNSAGPVNNWDNLKSLKPGQIIQVVTRDMNDYQGEFKILSGSGITLRRKKHERTLDRDKVVRVSVQAWQSHRGRNAVIGATVGAGVGLGIGLAANHVILSHTNCTEGPMFFCGYPPFTQWPAILTPVGGLFGGAIGAGLSKGGWREIYRAR